MNFKKHLTITAILMTTISATAQNRGTLDVLVGASAGQAQGTLDVVQVAPKKYGVLIDQIDEARNEGKQGRVIELLRELRASPVEVELLSLRLSQTTEPAMDVLASYQAELRYIDQIRQQPGEIAAEAKRASIRRTLYEMGFGKTDAENLSKLIMSSDSRAAEVLKSYDRDSAFKGLSEAQRNEVIQQIETTRMEENPKLTRDKIFRLVQSLGYSLIPADYITQEIWTQADRSVADILKTVDAQLAETEPRVQRSVEAMKNANSGRIDSRTAVERSAKK